MTLDLLAFEQVSSRGGRLLMEVLVRKMQVKIVFEVVCNKGGRQWRGAMADTWSHA